MQFIDLIVPHLTTHKTDFQTDTLEIVGNDPVQEEITKSFVCKISIVLMISGDKSIRLAATFLSSWVSSRVMYAY